MNKPKKDSVRLRPIAAALVAMGAMTLVSCASVKDVMHRATAPEPTAPAAESTTPPADVPAGTAAPTPAPSANTAPAKPAAGAAAMPPAARGAARGAEITAPDGSRQYPGTGQFVKQTPPTAEPPMPSGETFSLNFEALDIRQIVQYIMGDYLKESFTIHPLVTGSATIRTSQPVARKDLIPILEKLLRDNGQVMVREEGMYRIMPASIGTRGAVTPQLAGAAPLPNGFSVQYVQLKYVGVKDMQRILEPYAVEPQSSIRVDEVRNMLMISGTQRELKHMMEVIDLFDVDFLAGYSIGLFPMQSDVKTLQADLDKLFGAAAQGVSPLAGIVRIIPIERMNGLLVVTTQPKYLEEAKKWIDRLDKGGGLAGGMRLNVYQVQHGKAEKLAQLLSDIYGGNRGSTGTSPTLAPGQRPVTTSTTPTTPTGAPTTTTTTPTTPANPFANALSSFALSLGGNANSAQNARIIADTDNNALLVLATPSDYETLVSALRQLDVPRRQVLVEVLVAEVSLTDELKFGIEWFINARNNTIGSLRNPSTNGILPSVLPNSPSTGGTDPRTGTTPLIGATPGLQLINLVGSDVRAVLQALGDDGRATVESRPNILILDNEKGSINVGTQISVSTGTSTSTGGVITTSNQYINTGVILNVTPRINAGGRVTLDISQEVSSVGSSGSNTNPPINSRKVGTVANVASGETMVLAGLIQRDYGSSSQGVPLLSKIPVIGGLFGSQSYRNNRTELIVLITPLVVSNDGDARKVTDELRKKLPSLESFLQKSKP
jgi:general secretion pathway protein D